MIYPIEKLIIAMTDTIKEFAFAIVSVGPYPVFGCGLCFYCRMTVKLTHLFSSPSTVMRPLCASTMDFAMASPSP